VTVVAAVDVGWDGRAAVPVGAVMGTAFGVARHAGATTTSISTAIQQREGVAPTLLATPGTLGAMDVLVIVGGTAAPARLLARANHHLVVRGDPVPPDTIAELRAHIPHAVGVVGALPDALRVARDLHRAGLPVTFYTDEVVTADAGVEVDPITDRGPAMDVADSLVDLFGHTPMVRLDRLGRDLSGHLLAKLEYLNPGGSVKDRPALAMVEAAEAAGLLLPGGTIVEPTSGNTGVGLALVAARRRYRCVFTMPDKIATEKVQLLRAFGAEVIVCPTAVAPEHPDSYYSVARRVTESTPGAFQPDQYHNPNNPAAHEATTGPEIWDQTAGRITHFVTGIGTGGTISGVGRALKARNPAIRVIGADPEGSVYSGGSGRPYLVEGIGEDFWPDTYDPSVVDEVVQVSDRDSFLTARRLTREEGILAGGSCGTAAWAALAVGRRLGPDAVIVVLLPDSGRGYLSKVYNDQWLADHGFLRAGGETVAEVMNRKGQTGPIPPLVHAHPDETVRETIALLKEYGVSQMPVVKAEPPLSLAEVVGAVSDRSLLERAFHDPSVVDRPVGEVMDRPLPTIGMGETIDEAATRLQQSQAVVVLDSGHPVGVLTRSDLLEFLATAR
jgi:cystathionine beta-synthase